MILTESFSPWKWNISQHLSFLRFRWVIPAHILLNVFLKNWTAMFLESFLFVVAAVISGMAFLIFIFSCCCSVTKSCLTLWPHGLQPTRSLSPPLSPEVCSNSCPLSWWCYLIISSSATHFSFCLQSLLASWSFPMNWLCASGQQSNGVSVANI